jgi:hypothetical protein
MKHFKWLTALSLTAITILFPACAQINAQVNEWVPCATEGGLCRVNGEGVVRFGIEGRYEYRSVSGPVMCNTDTFGDPAQGLLKSCAVNTSGSTSGNPYGRNNGDWNRPNPNASGSASAGGWLTCAQEDDVCRFNGTRPVRYGVPGHYMTGMATNGMACNNQTFGGDPAPGTRKHCQVGNGDVRSSSPSMGGYPVQGNSNDRSGPWVACAQEGELCRVPRDATVRFGVQGRYAYAQNVQQPTPCTTDVFGDPAPGTRKRCEFSPPSNANNGGWEGRDSYPDGRRGEDRDRRGRNQNDAWTPCAQEGGYCRVPRTTDVRFGANGAYTIVRNVAGGIACNTATFGDPAQGTPKQCEYAR